MKTVPLTWAQRDANGDGILFSDATVYENVEGAGRAFRRDLPPGIAEWCDGYKALVYVCPCGCGSVGCVSVHSVVKIEKAWLWDGNPENPTLSPSILHTWGCRWHGYLRNGIWEQC